MIHKGWFMDAGAFVSGRSVNSQDDGSGHETRSAMKIQNFIIKIKNYGKLFSSCSSKKNQLYRGTLPRLVFDLWLVRFVRSVNIFFYLILQYIPEKDNSLLEKCA
jgi:hypothetical protein